MTIEPDNNWNHVFLNHVDIMGYSTCFQWWIYIFYIIVCAQLRYASVLIVIHAIIHGVSNLTTVYLLSRCHLIFIKWAKSIKNLTTFYCVSCSLVCTPSKQFLSTYIIKLTQEHPVLSRGFWDIITWLFTWIQRLKPTLNWK